MFKDESAGLRLSVTSLLAQRDFSAFEKFLSESADLMGVTHSLKDDKNKPITTGLEYITILLNDGLVVAFDNPIIQANDGGIGVTYHGSHSHTDLDFFMKPLSDFTLTVLCQVNKLCKELNELIYTPVEVKRLSIEMRGNVPVGVLV